MIRLSNLWNLNTKPYKYIVRTSVLHNPIEPGHSGADPIGCDSMGWSNRQFHGMRNLYKNCKWGLSVWQSASAKRKFLFRHPGSSYILDSSFYSAVSLIYDSAIKNLHTSFIMPSRIHDAHHSQICQHHSGFSTAPAHLNAVKNRALMSEAGTSEYSYVPSNFLACLYNAVLYLYIRVYFGSLREAGFSITRREPRSTPVSFSSANGQNSFRASEPIKIYGSMVAVAMCSWYSL